MRRGFPTIIFGAGAAACIALWLWWPAPAPHSENARPVEVTLPVPAPSEPAPPLAPAQPAPTEPMVAALPPALSAAPVAPPAPLTVDHQVIARVQFFLEQLGHSVGVADGVMGRRTKTAVAAFRRSHGLPPGEDIDGPLFYALERAHRRLPKATDGVPAAAPRIPVDRAPLSGASR